MVILLVAQTIGNLYLPNLNADIINNGVEKGNIRYIFTTGGVMLAIALAVGVLAIVAVYWASRVAMGAGADMRAAVFTRVQSFSAREVNRFGTPSLITRIHARHLRVPGQRAAGAARPVVHLPAR